MLDSDEEDEDEEEEEEEEELSPLTVLLRPRHPSVMQSEALYAECLGTVNLLLTHVLPVSLKCMHHIATLKCSVGAICRNYLHLFPIRISRPAFTSSPLFLFLMIRTYFSVPNCPLLFDSDGVYGLCR